MKRYEFNKLIRSKIPARMLREGIKISSKQLTKAEYIQELKNKLVEEAKEVQEAEGVNNLTTELADLLEVILTLAKELNIDRQAVEDERLKKRKINGRFLSQNYIHYIEVALDNFKVIEYLENKNRPYKFASLS